MIENYTTILTPFYNTDLKHFEEHLIAMKNIQCKKIYYNDGSNQETINMFMKHKDEIPNLKYIDGIKNIGLIKSVYKLTRLVNTDYIMRIDSDDILHEFPKIKLQYMKEHADILFPRTKQEFIPNTVINCFLNGPKVIGVIWSVEAYKIATQDHNTIEKHFFFHEDLWGILNINVENIKIKNKEVKRKNEFRLKGTDKFKKNFYKNSSGSQMTMHKVTDKRVIRWDTFFLYCYMKDYKKLYYDTSISVLGMSDLAIQRLGKYGQKHIH